MVGSHQVDAQIRKHSRLLSLKANTPPFVVDDGDRAIAGARWLKRAARKKQQCSDSTRLPRPIIASPFRSSLEANSIKQNDGVVQHVEDVANSEPHVDGPSGSEHWPAEGFPVLATPLRM